MNGKCAAEILLVEDNFFDAETVIIALKEQNPLHNIHYVKDGAVALEYLFETGGSLKKEPPKVIILDLKLPKIDGIEVLRRIKSHEHAKNIPVVVLTSSNQESDIQECYRLGVNSFVTKPLEFGNFLKVVSDLGCYWLILNKTPESC